MRHRDRDSTSEWRGKGERWRRMSPLARIAVITGGVIVAAGFFVLGGFVVVWLWNWLMPAIFRLPTIGFWEAWGLMILSSIFFKGRLSSANRLTREQRRKRALRERMRGVSGDEESDTPPSPGPEGGEPSPG